MVQSARPPPASSHQPGDYLQDWWLELLWNCGSSEAHAHRRIGWYPCCRLETIAVTLPPPSKCQSVLNRLPACLPLAPSQHSCQHFLSLPSALPTTLLLHAERARIPGRAVSPILLIKPSSAASHKGSRRGFEKNKTAGSNIRSPVLLHDRT